MRVVVVSVLAVTSSLDRTDRSREDFILCGVDCQFEWIIEEHCPHNLDPLDYIGCGFRFISFDAR